jgi:hypothetical protein
VIVARRWAVVAWRTIVARTVHDRTFNHIRGLVINRRRWWRVIDGCWRRIHRGRCGINRTRSHRSADHAADDCANDCSSTPAWAAAMGFSLTCEGEGT